MAPVPGVLGRGLADAAFSEQFCPFGFELLFVAVFQVHEFQLARVGERAEQLIHREMERLGVAVLGVLDEKDH
jgi:hypothetical protein